MINLNRRHFIGSAAAAGGGFVLAWAAPGAALPHLGALFHCGTKPMSFTSFP